METILKRTKYLFNSLLFIFKPDLIFDIGSSGHSGWNKIYSDKENINWLLSWKKNKI